jgi:Fe-S oxidoreductase
VSYHTPCHGRVQNIGKRTEELLKLIPGTFVHTNERCSGHAGTFGVKKPYHEVAMKIGKPLFKRWPSTRRAARPTTSAPTARWAATTSTRASSATPGRAAAGAPAQPGAHAYGLD